MEVEVTWKRAVRVWWSYTWRNLIAGVFGMIIAAIIAGNLALMMSVMGSSEQMVTYATGAIGFTMGLIVSIIPIKLILNKSFGDFRLVLVRAEPEDENNERVLSSTEG
ncbi:hypothetical protein ACR0ST_00590 [Aliidiomarina sp. Khilg15.8]